MYICHQLLIVYVLLSPAMYCCLLWHAITALIGNEHICDKLVACDNASSARASAYAYALAAQPALAGLYA